ncbi:hypothetical protein DCS_07469 [Drechmeria coniospora]|uniref:Uncharacterized protein n=1 Tax=Drechmeria coniospora TaxID=98403 RepID=A0A151GEJ7_DRECN|nr:hypothetical protein DCS_07469 [Drechmeria coniospora]KYK55506.1 hypothetical protein DCS_07469 [Drechmeria coniospora]
MRAAQDAEAGHVRPAQVLSPTSSNSRLANREWPASPTKSQIARPGSPLKMSGNSRSAAVTTALSSMVEKAKASRNGKKAAATSGVNSANPVTTSRSKRPAAAVALKSSQSRPATRAGRRASGTSEASEASTGTVIRKAVNPATRKKAVVGTVRKVVAGAAKRPAAKGTATTATTATTASTSGRVLRKRG